MNFEIDKKQIEIFYNETENKKIPVIILNTFSGEGNKVWEECKKLNAKDFILVAISKMSWSNDMTPWECPPLYKGDSYCKGYADEYLKLIEDEIIPKVEGFITNELQKEIEYRNKNKIKYLFTKETDKYSMLTKQALKTHLSSFLNALNMNLTENDKKSNLPIIN